jgi:alpha-mannosidase
VGYKYFGVGDIGGAPDAESVQWLEKAITGSGPVRVLSRPADQLYRDLEAEHIERLPAYSSELLMTRHGTGCYTSAAWMKRWNRRNELLADAAERASVAAAWLGGAAYPGERLAEAWTRVLWHHHHDDLTGTSIPQAYPFSWNDEVISLNQFAGILTNAVGAVARALNTRADGVPLVVFNPLVAERTDVVSARVPLTGQGPAVFGALGPDGKPALSQPGRVQDNEIEILILAQVPSLSFSVFDVCRSAARDLPASDLSADDRRLENDHYRVAVDDRGDIASFFDKTLGRELLSAPIRLALLRDVPDTWPEWEIYYRDITAEPYAYFDQSVEIKLVEAGPVRATLEVRRQAHGSTALQRIRLAAGAAGDRVEIETILDWRTPATLLKAVFPLAAANPRATYDLGFGVIERPGNTETLYEVPAQQWADLTDGSGAFGVTIMNDGKTGWDKPDERTLRLTLIHTPNDVEKDMGWHRFTYALAGHSGDWRAGDAVRRAARLNQPLMPFATAAHDGRVGRQLSVVSSPSPQVEVRAFKQAERDDELILRVQEAHGRPVENTCLTFAPLLDAVRDVNGSELPAAEIIVGGASLARQAARTDRGRLCLDLAPFQPRSLAVSLAPPRSRVQPPAAQTLELPYDIDVVSADSNRRDGDFDGQGHSIPAELLPAQLVVEDIPFVFGPTTAGSNNALSCRKQSITLPAGEHNRMYMLAASADGRRNCRFEVDGRPTDIAVGPFSGWIGQADSLVKPDGTLADRHSLAPAYIERDSVAWVGTHLHDARRDRNEPYVFCYLFKYAIDLPAGAAAVTLPDDPAIRIMAMTVAANHNDDTTPAWPLYDDITAARIEPQGGLSIQPVAVTITADPPGAEIAYTLDGSEPGLDSPRYSAPFTLSQNATVRARAVRGGRPQDFDHRATFSFARPRPPESTAEVTSGLVARYYEGEWRQLPDFAALAPAAEAPAAGFERTLRTRDEHYAFEFTGYVSVPRDGVYTFYTSSDDGSRLYIGGQEIVSNDGLHGMREKNGQIALGAGLHSLRVTFFERGGDDDLVVSWTGPGIDKQVIPPSALFRAAADSIAPQPKAPASVKP